MMSDDDDILTPEFLALLARTYARLLETVLNGGVHGVDSAALEKVREELGLEKHHFLAALSQMCSAGILATDDKEKFFATKHTDSFFKLFRARQIALEAKKVEKA